MSLSLLPRTGVGVWGVRGGSRSLAAQPECGHLPFEATELYHSSCSHPATAKVIQLGLNVAHEAQTKANSSS